MNRKWSDLYKKIPADRRARIEAEVQKIIEEDLNPQPNAYADGLIVVKGKVILLDGWIKNLAHAVGDCHTVEAAQARVLSWGRNI